MENQLNRSRAIEPQISTYLHAKASRLGIPVSGTFELTPRCNFSCRMCYVHQQKLPEGQQELTAEQWLAIGRQAVDAGMVFLLLTGGEPFVRPDFAEIYTGLKAMGLVVSVNTNASLLSGKNMELLAKNPPSRLNISLYGGCAQTYEALCRVPAYDSVIRSLEQIAEIGIPVRLNVSVTPYNRSDLAAIYATARRLGFQIKASAYMFPPMRLGGAAGEAPARFEAEEAAAAAVECNEQQYSLQELQQMAAGYYPSSHEDCTGSEGTSMLCRAGSSSFWLKWDGRMVPCGMFPQEGFDVQTMGLAGAWQAVRAMTQAIRLPPECRTCTSRSRCCVCAAVCYTENGAFDKKPEYVCRMTDAIADIMKKKYGETL